MGSKIAAQLIIIFFKYKSYFALVDISPRDLPLEVNATGISKETLHTKAPCHGRL